MPVDMILEAMKVVYTRSTSNHSRSSFFSRTSLPRGSQYGFMESRSNSSHSTLDPIMMPTMSDEISRRGSKDDFRVSYSVKFYGSGTVRHYSDFGGCQMVMDRMIVKHHSFTSSLIQLATAKKPRKGHRCILIFTDSEMQIFGNDSKVLPQNVVTLSWSYPIMCFSILDIPRHLVLICVVMTTCSVHPYRKLVKSARQVLPEKMSLGCVYSIHPHPTRAKYFGVLADHSPSGTVHCFCYSTTNSVTSINVLCGFREACMHWLEKNLSSPMVEDIGHACDDTGEEEEDINVEGVADNYVTMGQIPSTSRGEGECVESDSSPDCHVTCSNTVESEWSSVSNAQEHDSGKNSLRRVSFAPCDQLQGVSHSKNPLMEVPTSSSESSAAVENWGKPNTLARDRRASCGKNYQKTRNLAKSGGLKRRSLYHIGPKLPRRNFPPPSPPPDISHYIQSPVHRDASLGSHKSQFHEDQLSLHVKKKLLALKLHEKMCKQRRRKRLMAVSGLESLSSELNAVGNSDDVRVRADKTSGEVRQPVFHSTPESNRSPMTTDDESNPTVYYTPKQSFHDGCWSDHQQVKSIAMVEGETAEIGRYSSTHSDSVSSSSSPSFIVESSSNLPEFTSTDQNTWQSQEIPSLDDDASTPHDPDDVIEDQPEDFDELLTNESKLSVVDENWWKKIDRSYYDDPGDERLCLEGLEDARERMDDDDSEDESVFVDPRCEPLGQNNPLQSPENSFTSKDISLEDLLDDLYPESEDYDPADHDPADYDPADYDPADYDPADYDPADYDPADHDPADYDPADHDDSELDDPHSMDEIYSTPNTSNPWTVNRNTDEVYSIPDTRNPWTVNSKITASFKNIFTQTEDCEDHNDEPDSKLPEISEQCSSNESDIYDPGVTYSKEINDYDAIKQEDVSLKESEMIGMNPKDTLDLDSLHCKVENCAANYDNRLALVEQELEQSRKGDDNDDGGDEVSEEAKALVLDPLYCATNLLESSHHSLAKSVHSLCRGAIIKQSNISLELALPLNKLCEEDEKEIHGNDDAAARDVVVVPTNGGEPSMMNVKLNSKILYSPQKNQLFSSSK